MKKIRPHQGEKEDVYILANGPSLTNELDTLSIDFFKEKDCVAVNFFAFSEHYKTLKPIYYVLSAPDIFLDHPAPEFEDKNEKLFRILEKETDWAMTLFVPLFAKKHKKWQSKIKNKNIQIHYYNTAVSEGSYWLVKWMLKKQLGLPRLQNVLIPSLTFMIYKKYKRIYLFGVDHSWLSQINVLPNNEVVMSHPHFYDKETKTYKAVKQTGESRKLHELLYKFYYTFKSYFDLRKYASDCGVEVYNVTEKSYIDAFERIEIEKLHSK